MPASKDSSNVYFPNKLINMKKSQKKTLKPLYLSVTKKKSEPILDEEKEKSLNSSSVKKTSIISKQNQPKTKNLIFQTQNYNTLNKSVLNSALNKSELNDDKNINNISKLDNSIIDVSDANKNEMGPENNDMQEGNENNEINENLEAKENMEVQPENNEINEEVDVKLNEEENNEQVLNENSREEQPKDVENKEEVDV